MREPFVFQSTATLARYTGLWADSARTLQKAIARVSGSSIYYHLHFALFRRHFMTAQFMNDFARWTWEALRDEPLAEQLAAVDPLEFVSIHEARQRLIQLIDVYLGRNELTPSVGIRARFHFLESQSFIFPNGLVADSLPMFGRMVRKAPAESVFHHFVAAPLRLGKKDNDFSHWLDEEQGAQHAAERVRQLSPYSTDLYRLGERIAELLHREGR
jgi:hypothetical protein